MNPQASRALARLEREVVRCRACPRLVAWRERAALERPARLASAPYRSRPVPGFGDERARLLILGLAPGAHGANRTGRPFTGDGAGPFLYGALHRAGFANAVVPTARGDGLELTDARITNMVRCAPPANQPSPVEERRCFGFLQRELELLPEVRVVLCLGGRAWNAALRWLAASGHALPRPRPCFAHGAELRLEGAPVLLGAYHPSQLNTSTKRLTAAMMDQALARARQLLEEEPRNARPSGPPADASSAIRSRRARA